MTREDYVKFFKKLLGEDVQIDKDVRNYKLEEIYTALIKDENYKLVFESKDLLERIKKELSGKSSFVCFSINYYIRKAKLEKMAKYGNKNGRDEKLIEFENYLIDKYLNNDEFVDLREFAEKCKFADINKIQQAVIKNAENWEYVNFIKHIPSANITQFEDALLSKSEIDLHDIVYFTSHVAGVDIKKCKM